jgi:hypothetical protein
VTSSCAGELGLGEAGEHTSGPNLASRDDVAHNHNLYDSGKVATGGGAMSKSLGLTSHKSNCNCTGCGMLRAGVCINCAERIATLILQSGLQELAVEPCSGACREPIQLYFSTPPERWRGQRAF